LIDLHLHLLPSVDDGAQDLAETVAMAELARSLGYTKLVATPHLQSRLDPTYAAHIAAAWDKASQPVNATGIELARGFEIRIDPLLPAWLEAGDQISLAGSQTLLVELPFAGWPIYTERTLFDVMSAGYRVLLAHPERYSAAMDDPSLLAVLHDRGVLFQVTTGSLAGLFGRPARSLAERLLREGKVDVLASDAHSAGRRFVSVSDGLAIARSLVGERRVRELVEVNPQAILNDEEIVSADQTVSGRPSTERSRLARVRQLLPRR
jgi:protein-tyrosine phosphatase